MTEECLNKLFYWWAIWSFR